MKDALQGKLRYIDDTSHHVMTSLVPLLFDLFARVSRSSSHIAEL